MIAIQCLAFAASYATRRDPPAFRKSPIWLNVGMAGVTTVTIRSALDGNPATVSLALFTALAQALQLLDARPRKSEFVLVRTRDLADARPELAREQYRLGSIPYFNLQQAIDRTTQAEQSLFTERYDYLIRWAELEERVGPALADAALASAGNP